MTHWMLPNLPRPGMSPNHPRRHLSTLAAALLTVAGVCLQTEPAAANGFDIYGLGARGTAMGGAQTAAATDFDAVYYNPALLTVRRKTHVGFAFQLVAPSLDIDRPASSPREADGGRDDVVPGDNIGVTAGVVFPVGGLVGDRIALGFAFYLPTLRATRLEAFDPTVPHYVIYQALPDQLVLSGGVAVEPLDGLRLGAGAQVLAALFGETTVDLDTTERRITRREIRADIDATVAPVLGVAWSPGPWIDLGFCWRGALDLAYALPIHFNFQDVGLLDIFITGSALYTPQNFNLGVAVHPAPRWTVALDLSLVRWSEAPAPTASIHATLDDSGLYPDREPGLLLDLSTVDFDPGFVDVLIPHLGLEAPILPWLDVRAGYAFRPTPIPNQVGLTNYLDADAHQLSAGAVMRFADPLEILTEPIGLAAFLQVTALPTRAIVKDPARDTLGIGSYQAGGSIINLGLDFRHDF